MPAGSALSRTDFNNLNTTGPITLFNGTTATTATGAHSANLNSNILRVGIHYKF